jgi:hypothetical protein
MTNHIGSGVDSLKELFSRDRFDTNAAAAYLTNKWGQRTAPKTMSNWRSEGRGPRYTRAANGRVVYERPDLDAFGQAQLSSGPVRNTTEEKNHGVTLPPGGPAARALRADSAA